MTTFCTCPSHLQACEGVHFSAPGCGMLLTCALQPLCTRSADCLPPCSNHGETLECHSVGFPRCEAASSTQCQQLEAASCCEPLEVQHCTLPPHHRFLLDFGSEVSPEALSTASEKLTIMEDMGLQPVSVKVLSQGSEPGHRLVQLSGAPACLQHIESRCLYSQLCDWESVAAAAREQVASLFCELQHRGFLVELSDAETSDQTVGQA